MKKYNCLKDERRDSGVSKVSYDIILLGFILL